MVADLTWVRAVLLFGEGVHDKDSTENQLLAGMLRTVSVLDPHWRTPHFYGGGMLRVNGDIDASDEIYARGMEGLPNDPYFPFSLAMNAYLYRKDVERAARFLDMAARVPGAPPWYSAAAGGVLEKEGRTSAALQYLREQIEAATDEASKAPLVRKYQRVLHDYFSEELTRLVPIYETHFQRPLDTTGRSRAPAAGDASEARAPEGGKAPARADGLRLDPRPEAPGDRQGARPGGRRRRSQGRDAAPDLGVVRRAGQHPARPVTAVQIVVGLGSSLGDRLATIRLAVARLARTPGVAVIRRSRAWKNPPAGGVARCPFVNAAVLVSWEGEAQALFDRTQAIERALGRPAGHARWADRAIDLDLLLADAVVEGPELRVPHPRLLERPFALVPAAEVAPDWIVEGRSLLERARAVSNGLIPVAVL